MQKIALVLQGPESEAGLVEERLNRKGYDTVEFRLALGEDLPDIAGGDWAGTVLYGGPMSANDEHLPQIPAQLAWLETAFRQDHPVFGICLGGQLMARALGATVKPHDDGMTEVGFVEIQAITDETGPFSKDMPVFHWHKEGFDLPAGATRLMTGNVYPNQAYRHSSCHIGVQFHPEMQLSIMQRWHSLAPECFDWKGAQSADQHVADYVRHANDMTRWMDSFIDHWLGAKP